MQMEEVMQARYDAHRDAVDAAVADVIHWARKLVMEPGGLRMTPDGTYIVERADRSDPHYQLCEAFKRLDELMPKNIGQ